MVYILNYIVKFTLKLNFETSYSASISYILQLNKVLENRLNALLLLYTTRH
jgi:hypothetical protein